MKAFALAIALGFFASGCATTSTVAARRQERASAYASLPTEQRALIDQGHIKVGFSADAVYIAWGPPAQILRGESETGSTTTWIYSGTGWQERGYWTYRHSGYPYGWYGYAHPLPVYEHDYIPYRYTSAEVVFENGVVKSWKHITPPPSK